MTTQHEPYDGKTKAFIIFLAIIFGIFLLSSAKHCHAQTNPAQPSRVTCNWVPSMDTIHFKTLVIYDQRAAGLTVLKNSYIVKFIERFYCPDVTRYSVLAERNARIYYEGKEIEAIYISPK